MQKLLHNKTFIISFSLAVGIAIILGTLLFISNKSTHYSTIQIKPLALTEHITATGKVEAENNVSLAFDRAGTVSKVNVKVGDTVLKGEILGELRSDDLYVNLEGAKADLASARAKLDQLQAGTLVDSTQVTTSKLTLYNSVLSGFTVADDAIRNKIDQFFTDPKTLNPKILFAFRDYDLKEKVNNERIVVEETLTLWNKLNSTITADSVSNDDAEKVREYAIVIKTFIEDISLAVNDFQSNATLPQSTIDKYKNDVATARTNINTTLSNLTNAQESIRSTLASKPVQEAAVAKAQATVDGIISQINHTIITAPFAGVVTLAEPKIGEVFSSGATAFTLMTKDIFKVEIQIPELDIAKVKLNDDALITLDAYGTGELFKAHVSEIDPAETVVNGVGTYKVTLLFDNIDARIYSGMTANIEIITQNKENALAVPTRSIITRGNEKFVLAQEGTEFKERKVTTGITGSNGYTEILSGLSENEIIATFNSNK